MRKGPKREELLQTVAYIALLPCVLSCATTDTRPKFSFEDVTEEVGIERHPPSNYGSLWADLNSDGWVDLAFMIHGPRVSFYINNKGASFIDQADPSAILPRNPEWRYAQHGDGHGGSCADFDNDGAPDIAIAYGAKRGETLGVKYDRLLRNQGGLSFREVSHETGTLNPEGRARLPTWADYDNDGFVDLYIGNYASPNVLYRNSAAGLFLNTTGEAGLALKQAAHPSWADYDNDGDVDLLAVWPPALHRNNGDGTFTEVTREARLVGPKNAASLAWGDFDNDGDSDVFIGARPPGKSRLYRNDGGLFMPAQGQFGPHEGEEGTGSAWGDLDNDGDLDLIILGTKSMSFFENKGGGLSQVRVRLGASFAPGKNSDVALADYDNDGYLDLAVNAQEGKYLLKNVRRGNSWLKISLEGTASNRMGLGAKVEIAFPDGRKLFREYLGDTGFFKSNGCGPLHVGLKRARAVDVRILWPSGAEQSLFAVAVNQMIRVVEP